MLKRLLDLFADTLAYGVSGFLAQIIGFLLLPLYTRQLAPSDYGVLAMLAVLPAVFHTLASAGTKSAVYKFFYAEQDSARRPIIISTAAAGVVFWSTIVLACASLFSGQIGHLLLGTAHDYYLIQIALISAAVATINEVPTIALRAERRAKTVGLLNIVFLLVSVSLNIVAVLVLKLGVRGLVNASLIANTIQMALAFFVTRKSFATSVDIGLWRKMARYALPFLPHRLQAAAMGFVAEYSIRTYLGLAEAGLYSVALKFATPLVFITGAFQQAWIPYKFKVHAEDENSAAFFRSFFSYFLAIVLYLWVGIAAWGPEALRILTAPTFHDASYLVWATAMVVVARSIPPMLSVGIELCDHAKLVPVASFIALVVLIVGSVIITPKFGAIGAAVASTISWLALASSYFYLGQKQLKINYDWQIAGALLLVAFFAVFTLTVSQRWSLSLRLFIEMFWSLVFPLFAAVILSFSPTEGHRIRRFIGSTWNRFSLPAVSRNSRL